jgi:hypothetical protein
MFRDTIQLHISLKNSFLEVEYCCICVRSTCTNLSVTPEECNRCHNMAYADLNLTNWTRTKLGSLSEISGKESRLLGWNEYVWRERRGILTAIQRNTIRMLRKAPNAQVALMSGIIGGCSLLFFTKEIFPSGFPRHYRRSLWKDGGDY